MKKGLDDGRVRSNQRRKGGRGGGVERKEAKLMQRSRAWEVKMSSLERILYYLL